MSNVLAIAAGIVVIGGALAALTKWVILPTARVAKQVIEFLEDWRGTPARPGVDAVDGVMARLKRVEHQTSRAEFHLGNGNPVPMRKIVEAVDERTAKVENRLGDLETTVEFHHGPSKHSAPSPDTGPNPWAPPARD